MNKAYTSLAQYYDLLFQEKDYDRETDFIKQVIKKYLPGAKSILDVGCGTGNHLNMLVGRFETLYGVDLNPEIINVAKKKSSKIKYFVGSLADFNINLKFDVITCLYSVFNYNQTINAAEKTLQNFKKHLNPGGIIIIALYTPTNTQKKIALNTGKYEDVEVAKIDQWTYDPKTKIETSEFLVLVKNNNQIDFFTENNHKFRIYQVSEFKELLTNAGFIDIKVFDNFVNKPVSKTTKYPIFIASNKG